MQPDTHRTIIRQDFYCLVHFPQASPVPTNTDAAEIPRYIQLHAAQMDQWRQMVNAEGILKQECLGSPEVNYFKGKRHAYINYANHILAGLIQNLYDDHGTISPMDIEEIDQKMKQELSLLDPVVDLFEKIEEGVEFAEAANTPITGGKMANIAFLLIPRTRGMKKSCEQWEYMQVGMKTWQAFKDQFAKSYRRYRIRKNKNQRPMGMGRQQITNMTQSPKSILWMRCKHLHVHRLKTRRKWQTSPASTSYYIRA